MVVLIIALALLIIVWAVSPRSYAIGLTLGFYVVFPLSCYATGSLLQGFAYGYLSFMLTAVVLQVEFNVDG